MRFLSVVLGYSSIAHNKQKSEVKKFCVVVSNYRSPEKIADKSKEIAEDVAKDLEKEMQTVTDRYIQEIDSLLKKKEKELTEF